MCYLPKYVLSFNYQINLIFWNTCSTIHNSPRHENIYKTKLLLLNQAQQRQHRGKLVALLTSFFHATARWLAVAPAWPSLWLLLPPSAPFAYAFGHQLHYTYKARDHINTRFHKQTNTMYIMELFYPEPRLGFTI